VLYWRLARVEERWGRQAGRAAAEVPGEA
jgi:hypothetical protein